MYNCTIYENMVEMAFNVKHPFFTHARAIWTEIFVSIHQTRFFELPLASNWKWHLFLAKIYCEWIVLYHIPFPSSRNSGKKRRGGGRILQPYTKNRLLQIDTWKFCMLLNYIYTVNDFTEGNKFYGIHGMC